MSLEGSIHSRCHRLINSPANNFGSLEQFTVDLKKAFEASDSEGDARAKLRQLKQGKDSVDDYVAQFRILAGKARMTDNAALTEYFMEGVNTGILQKIFAQKKLPATITELVLPQLELVILRNLL